MDLLALWKVFFEVMNTHDHNSPSFGVIMGGPKFRIRNWVGPFEVDERVTTMKEHKDVCHVRRVGKPVLEFEPPLDTCIFFIDKDPSRESSWVRTEFTLAMSGNSVLVKPPKMCLNIIHR